MRDVHALMTEGICQKCGGVRLVEYELRLCFVCLGQWEAGERKLEMQRKRFAALLDPVPSMDSPVRDEYTALIQQGFKAHKENMTDLLDLKYWGVTSAALNRAGDFCAEYPEKVI